MVKKRAIALLDIMPEYREVVTYIKNNGSVTASNIHIGKMSKIKIAYMLKHMYDMELLNRKKEKDTWVYTLPIEILTTKYSWE